MGNPIDQRASSPKYRWSILDIAIATAFVSALFALFVNSWAAPTRFAFATFMGVIPCSLVIVLNPKKRNRNTIAKQIGAVDRSIDNNQSSDFGSIVIRTIDENKDRRKSVGKTAFLLAATFFVLVLAVYTGLAALFSILIVAFAGLVLISFLYRNSAAGPPFRIRLMAAAISLLLGLFVWNCFPPPELQRFLKLKDQFPVVDLTNRLRKIGDPINVNEMQVDPPELSHRQRALERLHSPHYESFIRQTGFGVTRMMSVHRGELEFEIPLTPLATTFDQFLNEFRPQPNFASPEKYLNFLAAQGHEISPTWDSHQTAEELFLTDSASGFRPQSRLATGFVPHGFLFPLPEDNYPAKKWELKNLQLISLNRFDEPRAYVTDNFPNMKELSSDDIPTRPLNSAEQSMLKMLKVNDKLEFNLASLESAKSLKMLGSLNAKHSCLDCHSGKVGDTLGLFTYEFIPKESMNSDEKNPGNDARHRGF